MDRSELRETAVACIRVFVFAAAPVFVSLVAGISEAPNFDAGKALVVSAALGAAAAGVRAVYGAFRRGQIPFPEKGV